MTTDANKTNEAVETAMQLLTGEHRDAILQRLEDGQAAAFYYEEEERRAWQREQYARAPQILALLRKHIAMEQMQEVEKLLSDSYGCDYIRATGYRLMRSNLVNAGAF